MWCICTGRETFYTRGCNLHVSGHHPQSCDYGRDSQSLEPSQPRRRPPRTRPQLQNKKKTRIEWEQQKRSFGKRDAVQLQTVSMETVEPSLWLEGFYRFRWRRRSNTTGRLFTSTSHRSTAAARHGLQTTHRRLQPLHQTRQLSHTCSSEAEKENKVKEKAIWSSSVQTVQRGTN